jgi:hypothetical protein
MDILSQLKEELEIKVAKGNAEGYFQRIIDSVRSFGYEIRRIRPGAGGYMIINVFPKRKDNPNYAHTVVIEPIWRG